MTSMLLLLTAVLRLPVIDCYVELAAYDLDPEFDSYDLGPAGKEPEYLKLFKPLTDYGRGRDYDNGKVRSGVYKKEDELNYGRGRDYDNGRERPAGYEWVRGVDNRKRPGANYGRGPGALYERDSALNYARGRGVGYTKGRGSPRWTDRMGERFLDSKNHLDDYTVDDDHSNYADGRAIVDSVDSGDEVVKQLGSDVAASSFPSSDGVGEFDREQKLKSAASSSRSGKVAVADMFAIYAPDMDRDNITQLAKQLGYVYRGKVGYAVSTNDTLHGSVIYLSRDILV